MRTATLSPMLINLTRTQRAKIERRAKRLKQPMSVVVRTAIDTYLSLDERELTGERLELLDAATRRAEEDLAAINRMLDEMSTGHRAFLEEIRAIRAGRGR